jgi:hypothetical protein
MLVMVKRCDKGRFRDARPGVWRSARAKDASESPHIVLINEWLGGPDLGTGRLSEGNEGRGKGVTSVGKPLYCQAVVTYPYPRSWRTTSTFFNYCNWRA